MLIDWLIYALLLWGIVAVLNATIFKRKAASTAAAWALTIGMFFVNLAALTALQIVRYKFVSQDMGLDIKPRSPFDLAGAIIASWWFYFLLRKSSKTEISPDSTAPTIASTVPENQNMGERLITQTITATPSRTQHRHAAMDPETTNIINRVDEDQIYTDIAKELETGATDKGLWIKLFAECGGDETQTKVLYIKQRADKLITAEHYRLSEIACAQAAEAKRLEMLKITKDKEREFLIAVWEGNISAANQLLLEGIKPDYLKDENGRSPLDLAETRGDHQMIRLLQDNNMQKIHAEQILMSELGITFDGERYHFQDYRYDKLADAISYARKERVKNAT